MREGAITSETEMDETGMKPRFHHYDIEILLFMRCETGETELPHFLNSGPRSFELVGCYFHTNSF